MGRDRIQNRYSKTQYNDNVFQMIPTALRIAISLHCTNRFTAIRNKSLYYITL